MIELQIAYNFVEHSGSVGRAFDWVSKVYSLSGIKAEETGK